MGLKELYKRFIEEISRLLLHSILAVSLNLVKVWRHIMIVGLIVVGDLGVTTDLTKSIPVCRSW